MSKDSDFWTRRRQAVEAEAEADERAAARLVEDAELAERAQKEDAEILKELDLPDPDSLELGDNVQAFMSRTVPDRLRRRALRRLWRLNPVLANLDGLVDYGEDFTDAATVVENLQTTYQVGKGMLAHVEAMAREAEAEAAEDDADDAPEAFETEGENAAEEDARPSPDPEPEVAAAGEPENDDAGSEAGTLGADEQEIEFSGTRPRRMRFVFEG